MGRVFIISLLLAAMFWSPSLSAQNVFGVKAGMMFQPEVNGTRNLIYLYHPDGNIIMPDITLDRMGFTGGIYWRSEFLYLPVFFQPELMYYGFNYKSYITSKAFSIDESGNVIEVLPDSCGYRQNQ